MQAVIVGRGDQYVLNHCTRSLARDEGGRRHDFGQYALDDDRAGICDAWRFPVVDSYFDGQSMETSYRYNTVTFVYDGRSGRPAEVAATGTFMSLHESVPLRELQLDGAATALWTASVRVPKGQVHTYKLRVDGQWRTDPLNPQTAVLDNGRTWSRFFTEACQVPLSFTRRERELLSRLVGHLLPFRVPENSRFIRDVYSRLDRADRVAQFPLAYRLDEDVGVVNYIDKLVARPERHNLDDYRTCLALIDGVLRQRFPGRDPSTLPPDAFTDLYTEMKDGAVAGWNTSRYENPRFFLLLLRRHAMTGAFVHPRHGGNSGAVGWAYLAGRYPFDWAAAMESPLGRNEDYRG